MRSVLFGGLGLCMVILNSYVFARVQLSGLRIFSAVLMSSLSLVIAAIVIQPSEAGYIVCFFVVELQLFFVIPLRVAMAKRPDRQS